MSIHDRHLEALGAYSLGALDPAEMVAVHQHLQECPVCRHELRDLESLRAILDRGLVAQGRAWPLGRRTRRWASRPLLVGMAVGAAVLLVAIGSGLALFRSSPTSTVYSFTSVDRSVHATGTVSYEQEAWGTQLVIRMVGLPTSLRCVIWVESRRGGWQEAGSWRSSRRSETQVEAASVVPRTSIRGVSLRTPSGTTLLEAGGPGSG
ncbi:MAG: zf-HC2 domain-containing protein [Candidatus Dormibacteraeota bacterium]|nr:zf-HC2 domain-containing protein [Candidatus Dormibacteraeota bacterium]